MEGIKVCSFEEFCKKCAELNKHFNTFTVDGRLKMYGQYLIGIANELKIKRLSRKKG